MKITLSDYALSDIYTSTEYPIIRLELNATGELDELADNVRKAEGLIPFFDDTDKYDNTAWYDFYAKVNLETEELVEIEAITFSQNKENTELTYEIPVNKKDIMSQINEQLEISLAEIRAEYVKEMDYE